MTNRDLCIHIRLALLDLGRDTDVRLPRTQAELKDMLKSLRQEQIASPTSNLKRSFA